MPVFTENDYYEVRAVTGKGYGCFAIKDIKRGTRILADAPLLVVPAGHYLQSDIEKAFDRLSPADKSLYFTLASGHGQDPTWWPNRIHATVVRCCILHIERFCGRWSMLSLSMAFRIRRLMYHATIVAGPRAPADQGATRCANWQGTVSYEHLPNQLHGDEQWCSRVPTCSAFQPLVQPERKLQLVRKPLCFEVLNNSPAIRSRNPAIQKETIHIINDVKAGEEITLSYCDMMHSKAARAWELKHYGFVCDCRACTEDEDDQDSFAYKSAQRRFRIAELDGATRSLRGPGGLEQGAQQAGFVRQLLELASLHIQEGDYSVRLASM